MRVPGFKPAPPREKAEEAWVIDLFKKCGLHVWKTSQPRASMMTEGIPDLWVFCPRRELAFWWEVKNQRAMQKRHLGLSPAQQRFRELCHTTHTRHYIGGLEEARHLLDSLGITLSDPLTPESRA